MVSDLALEGISPRTVIDVGANIGQFAVAAERVFGPRIALYCFEPVPQCAQRLREHLRRCPMAVVHELALAEHEGESNLNLNTHSHSSSLLPLADGHRQAFPTAREIGQIPVRLTTLDRTFADVRFEPPVMLKLDVQGSEARVLRGGEQTLRRVDYVVLEASFRPMYDGEPGFLELARLMEALGFNFNRPVGWLVSPKTGEVLQADMLFTRRDTTCRQIPKRLTMSGDLKTSERLDLFV
jgi:FkbM family methyltransferase